MDDSGLPAAAFAAAVLRVSAHRGRVVVVKLGGSAMEDPAATDACLRSVVALHELGVAVVLVHGGGKPIDRAMAEAGLIPKKVAGRRFTDDATLQIVVRVLKDEINVSLVEKLNALGPGPGKCGTAQSAWNILSGEPLTLTGDDGTPTDLGRVGTITYVNDGPLKDIIYGDGHIPVIPSLATDRTGWLNINADTAASAVAGFLKADKAIFLTDTPGVLRDRSDPASLLPRLTAAECRDLIARGVIDGGMVPKVEACFEALDAGARAALILDGRVPFSLLDVFLKDTFTGTEIAR